MRLTIGFHFLLLLTVSTLRADINPDVVISQVHMGFLEIFNRSAHSVSIAGWSVQYTYEPGYITSPASWDAIALDGSLAPGQYYLIEVDGSNVFQPDVTGVFAQGTGLNFKGSIALVRGVAPQTTVWPSILDVVDLFGYGSDEAADGAPFPEQATNSFVFGPKAAIRLGNGCTENHNNATDFQLSPPVPRNTHSPAAQCSTMPSIRPNGIVNSASLALAPIAPGELLTIFGTNLGPDGGVGLQLTPDGKHVTTNLAGVQVLFDSVPAPVLYASANQVNVVAPFGFAGMNQTTVQVKYNGMVSNSQTRQVAPSAPGIFTSLGTGAGQAAALNENGSINTVDVPAAQDSIAVFYATGAGQTTLPSQDGLVTGTNPSKPALQVNVSIGGQPASVLYAGDAPGLVSGVLQVNARVPAGLSGRQPVVLDIGGVQRQGDVTVAVNNSSLTPQSYLEVNVPAGDIAYDSGANRLYASGREVADSVTVVDPSSGQILNQIQTARRPRLLAISDDGRYLYVSNWASFPNDSIQRIDLQTGQPDFNVGLQDIYPDYTAGAFAVSDMVVLPGQPRSLAIAVLADDHPIPIVIIDDNVRRPALAAPARSLSLGVGVLVGDQRLYLVNAIGPQSGPTYSAQAPLSDGVVPFAVQPAGNLLLTSTGLVMSGTGDDLLGGLPVRSGSGSWNHGFAFHRDTGLAYFPGYDEFGNNAWVAADLATYLPVALAVSNVQGFPGRLVPVGHGFATTLQLPGKLIPEVFIFPLSALEPLAAPSIPRATAADGKLRRFAIPNNSLALDPTGEHLYLSVPSYPDVGNSILDFDVASGQFGGPIWIGSEPDALTVSSDGLYLHVILDGSRSLVRLKLPGLTIDKQLHITADNGTLSDADFLLSLPSNAKSVVVGRYQQVAYGPLSAGVRIYDDGVPRPNATNGKPASGFAPPPVDVAQLSADGNSLYGLGSSNTGSPASRWRIEPDGLDFDSAGPSFGSNHLQFRCQNDLCLTGDGSMFDGKSLRIIGKLATTPGAFPVQLPLLDLANNRLFLCNEDPVATLVASYDAETLKLIGQYLIPNFPGAQSFEKVAGDQLAISNGGELVLLPISMLKPQ